MKKRNFGRTSLRMSKLGLNAAKFGSLINEAESFALLDAYYTGGGRVIQTVGMAPRSVMAQFVESGSEEIVGRWREARGIARDSLVLATRIAFFRPVHGGSFAFANAMRSACERSLRRLRTAHLDLLICDWDDELLPMEEFVEAIDGLIRAGAVRHAVAGNFPPWRVVDSLHRSSMGHYARFEGIQAEYSLMARDRFERDARALCREHGLAFLARSPLAGGFLARRPRSTHVWLQGDNEDRSEGGGVRGGDAVLEALAEIADKRLATPAQIALAWVLRDPQVTSALLSAATPRDLRELIRAADIILSPDEIGALANATSHAAVRREISPV